MSNRLGCIVKDYRRNIGAAIVAAILPLGGQALADQNLLCVLVPHFKDEYWLSVAYGLEQRSAELGFSVRFFEAGGYNALANQISQLDDCMTLNPGAILIGAVSSDAPELLAVVKTAATDRPVIGLVNELHSDALVAGVGVDWADMGRTLGQHLSALFPATGTPRKAVLLTGPNEAGWVAPLELGLREGLAASSVSIMATYGADTGTAEQLRLLERARAEHPEADLVIGTAPAIEAAMALFSAEDGPELVATYASHSVARGLLGGQVLAAPFDDPMQQGRYAVDAADAAVRGMNRASEFRTSIVILKKGTAATQVDLSPADYFPKLD